MNELPDATWRCGADGRCVQTSAAWQRYTCGTVPAACEHWLNAVHADDLAGVTAQWAVALEHGQPFERELRMRRHDGAYRWFRMSALPVRELGSTLLGWVGVHSDIHDLRMRNTLLSAELVRSEAAMQQLSAIVEGSEAAIISKDLDGAITSWNSGAERLFGYRRAEALGKPLRMLVPARFYGEEDWIMDCIRNGETVDQLETYRLRADGTEVFVSITVSPIYDPSGRLIGGAKLARDASELRRARMLSESANRQLEARVNQRTEELRRSHSELQRVANQLRRAQRVAEIGSWELDVETGEMLLSDELYRIFGIDPAAGAPRYSAGDPSPFVGDSQARLDRAIERCCREGQSYEVALEAERAGGERVHWIARGEPIVDGSGRVRRIVGTTQDVTQRELVARELRELSERLALATSVVRLGVWDWDLVQDRMVWDQPMRALYEVPPAAPPVSYETWFDSVHADDRLDLEAALYASLTGDKDLNCAFRVVVPGGRVKHVRAVATTTRDAQGRALRVVGVQVDISEQRIAELALRDSETLQRTVLANAGVCIVATDCEGVIKLFNTAAEELLGYPASEVVGLRTPAFLHDPSEVEQRRSRLERELGVRLETPFDVLVAKARDGVADINEWSYIRRDGTRVPVLLTVNAVRADDGTVGGFLGVAVDLSQRKRHERELLELNRLLGERSLQAEAANRAKSEFIANVSHDLRTPLAAVSGMSYLLGRTGLDEDQRALLSTLERSTKNLALMVNDILDLSKIEASQLALERQAFSLAGLLDELRGLMAGFALGKALELIIEPELAEERTLLGDRVRVLQILTNLAGNAIKFTERGSVHVRLRELASEQARLWLRFEVADTGPGIDEEARTRLFERFQRLDNAASRRVSGTGLGLAITKELSQLMGGRVGVTSQLGAGSTFWCELPFEPAASSSPSARGTRRSLLLLDAHAAQRAAIAASARWLGWSVHCAGSAREAGALLRTHVDFDCLLIDRKLAFAELSELLGERQGTTRPSIVLLGAQDGDRVGPAAPLADVVLGKPVTPNVLHEAVTRALGARNTVLPSVRPRAPLPGTRLATVRALVVDDNEVNRAIARRVLQIEGAEVEVAGCGMDALEKVASRPAYDVILMDVQLPDLDGIEVVRRLRAQRPPVMVPIVALTAGALASDRKRALEVGMDDFVSKPFEPATLIDVVQRWVERARGKQLAAAPSQAPGASSWPTIDGIDRQASQLRLGGDRALFASLLGLALRELDAFVAAPEPGSLAGPLHRLKGMMGNLGASALAQVLEQTEAALEAGDHAAVARGLAQLPSELLRLREGARAFLTDERVVPANDTGGVPELALGLELLAALLNAQDLDAVTLLSELAPLLTGKLGRERYRSLHDAVEQLDFALASQLLASA